MNIPQARWTGEPRANGAAVLLMGLAAVAYVAFVSQFGVNVLFQDEWSMVFLYRLSLQGRLTLTALWAQHNENRMLFPNLIMLLLDHASHFNTRPEMFASAAFLVLAVAVLAVAYSRSAGTSLLWFVPAAFVLFSWLQFAVALQGFAVALYLIVLCLVLSLAALRAAERHPWMLALAIAAAIFASYSSAQGLAVWAAGLTFLLVERRPRRQLWIWLASACLISGLYWIGFVWTQTGGGVRWAVGHPVLSLQYFALLAGGTVPTSSTLHFGLSGQEVVGAGVVCLGLAAFGYWVRRPASAEWLALPLGMITFGLLINLLITLGRVQLGLDLATSSRYTMFNLWLLAGVWLAWVAIATRSRTVLARAPVSVLGLLCLLQVVGAYHSGVIDGRVTRAQREQAVSLVRHYRTAPQSEVVPLVYAIYPQFKPLAAFLDEHDLSVFYRQDHHRP